MRPYASATLADTLTSMSQAGAESCLSCEHPVDYSSVFKLPSWYFLLSTSFPNHGRWWCFFLPVTQVSNLAIILASIYRSCIYWNLTGSWFLTSLTANPSQQCTPGNLQTPTVSHLDPHRFLSVAHEKFNPTLLLPMDYWRSFSSLDQLSPFFFHPDTFISNNIGHNLSPWLSGHSLSGSLLSASAFITREELFPIRVSPSCC